MSDANKKSDAEEILAEFQKAKDAIGNKFTIKRSVRYGISKIIFVKIN